MHTIRVMHTQDTPATEAEISQIKEAAERRARYFVWLAGRLRQPGGEAFIPYAADELENLAGQAA